MSYLKIEDLHASYGNIHALKGINLEVNKGEIVSIVGANGAGKTTLLTCISGLMSYKGSITYNGQTLNSKITFGNSITLHISKMSIAHNYNLALFHNKNVQSSTILCIS